MFKSRCETLTSTVIKAGILFRKISLQRSGGSVIFAAICSISEKLRVVKKKSVARREECSRVKFLF